MEGSPDGKLWREFDRKTNRQDFGILSPEIASFAVSKQVECRFIRLTQTDKNRYGEDQLQIFAVEFFGTLSE
jgi:hypothetical protein